MPFFDNLPHSQVASTAVVNFEVVEHNAKVSLVTALKPRRNGEKLKDVLGIEQTLGVARGLIETMLGAV